MRRMQVLLTIAASSAYASSVNADQQLLHCAHESFVLQDCSLTPAQLAEPVVEEGRTYQTEYLVTYAFPCSGHRLDVGMSAGEGYTPFVFGQPQASARVLGSGPLTTSDPDPQNTAEATLRRGCMLTVSSVLRLPSVDTVRGWSDEAKSLARIIDLSVQRYLLAKDYLEMAEWNRDKLLLLKDKLTSLVAAYPANLHYRVMLNHVNATLANQPSSVTLAELAEAGEDVRATLRRELDADVARGRSLLDRFNRWQQAAEDTLKDVLEHIPAE